MTDGDAEARTLRFGRGDDRALQRHGVVDARGHEGVVHRRSQRGRGGEGLAADRSDAPIDSTIVGIVDTVEIG